MNIEEELKAEFDKRGVNYAQNRCINYIDDSQQRELLIACKEALTFIGNEESSPYDTFGIMDLLRKAINCR